MSRDMSDPGVVPEISPGEAHAARKTIAEYAVRTFDDDDEARTVTAEIIDTLGLRP